MDHFAFWAFLLGALSAVSLLIGSILGVMWKPHRSVTASMTAFGGGALLAALAVELVAPTAMCVVDPDLSICHHGQPSSGEGAEVAHDGDNYHSSPVANFWALLIGSAIGGLLFVVLDQIVNANGGYLRKMATTITFMGKTQSRRTQQLLKQLSGIEFLRSIPPDEVQSLVDHVWPVTFHAGERLVKMGDAGDRIYFIDTGEVDVSDETGQVSGKLRAGDMFGEISLLTGAPRTATLTSVGVTHAFTLLKDDFERLRDRIPELEAHSRQIASERLKADDEREHRYVEDRAKWTEDAARALSQGTPVPSGAPCNLVGHSA
jgi:CRP-like cAMP-binding protein